MTQPALLSVWTVYDHPSDYPGHYVAREFLVHPDGPVMTDNVITSLQLEWLRDQLEYDMGLACLTRSPEDDPKIVETWL